MNEKKTEIVEALFAALLDEVALDLCFETHQSHYFQKHLKGRSKNDIFGNYPKNFADTFNCVHCQSIVTSSKFAPHLEKCMMGRGRRTARPKRT
mmetsp:Transcript_7855/g.14593  ORF Transcript_7855/g.14593 Transcript_7855/m.14593 type:complete len:94 (+) Transcript_7855:71-352(+)